MRGYGTVGFGTKNKPAGLTSFTHKEKRQNDILYVLTLGIKTETLHGSHANLRRAQFMQMSKDSAAIHLPFMTRLFHL